MPVVRMLACERISARALLVASSTVDGDEPARWRTRSVASADSLGPGTVADVLVTGAAPHHLMGNLVAVTARASRPRIPVVAI